MLADEMQKEIFVNPECGFDGISVNKDVLNWNIDQVKTNKPQGDQKSLPKEMEDSFAVLLQSVDSCTRYDKEISNIVDEKASPYYLGQKSAEEVALLIEIRINLILAERKDS